MHKIRKIIFIWICRLQISIQRRKNVLHSVLYFICRDIKSISTRIYMFWRQISTFVGFILLIPFTCKQSRYSKYWLDSNGCWQIPNEFYMQIQSFIYWWNSNWQSKCNKRVYCTHFFIENVKNDGVLEWWFIERNYSCWRVRRLRWKRRHSLSHKINILLHTHELSPRTLFFAGWRHLIKTKFIEINWHDTFPIQNRIWFAKLRSNWKISKRILLKLNYYNYNFLQYGAIWNDSSMRIFALQFFEWSDFNTWASNWSLGDIFQSF